jgi:lipoic acid synthetase/lipoate-protein ligase A
MLDGRKISGNAIYHLPGRTIAHGTLLYDTDMENMLHAITPPQEKLARNGVKSVRQRVALLKDYTSLSLDEIKAGLRRGICNKTVTLSPVDVEKIEEMAKEYEASEFIFSK